MSEASHIIVFPPEEQVMALTATIPANLRVTTSLSLARYFYTGLHYLLAAKHLPRLTTKSGNGHSAMHIPPTFTI